MEYEGPGDSSLAIGLYADGRIIVANVNYGWSAEKGRTYPEVSFELNGQSYTGTATGVEIVGKKGFAMKFGQEILADIAAARAVHVYKGDTLVDRLKLDGSAAALGVTKRCLASVRGKIAAAERERQRWAGIPKDPFAADKAVPRQAVARGSKTSWITNDDYPPAALRAGEEGTVVMDLVIDRLGRVEKCEVSGSSGSATLDAASCALVQRRARYTPATNDGGEPTSSTEKITFRWSIPR
jgi:protein TonB